MMQLPEMSLEAAAWIVFIILIVEVFKKIEVIPKVFLPLFSAAIGALTGAAHGATNGNIGPEAAAGFFVGLMASGAFDAGKSINEVIKGLLAFFSTGHPPDFSNSSGGKKE